MSINSNKKTLGIIGGMGPAATADLYTKIIAHTPATKDQDHLHIIIDADAEIPDRTGYILSIAQNTNAEVKHTDTNTHDHGKSLIDAQSQTNTKSIADSQAHNHEASTVNTHMYSHERLSVNSHTHTHDKPLADAHMYTNGIASTAASSESSPVESPLPYLTKSAHRLEKAGADFIVMACITAHIFADEISSSAGVPFFGIPEIAAKSLIQKGADKIVILSTEGTACAHIFDEPLNRLEIKYEYAAKNHGELMTQLIYSLVKSDNPYLADKLRTKAKRMLAQYRQRGFNHFLLACTELPIAFKMLGLIDDTFTDCTEELAKFCVKHALN